MPLGSETLDMNPTEEMAILDVWESLGGMNVRAPDVLAIEARGGICSVSRESRVALSPSCPWGL